MHSLASRIVAKFYETPTIGQLWGWTEDLTRFKKRKKARQDRRDGMWKVPGTATGALLAAGRCLGRREEQKEASEKTPRLECPPRALSNCRAVSQAVRLWRTTPELGMDTQDLAL